jgi:YfiH family protein
LGLRAGITGREGNFDLGLFADGRAGAVLEHWLSFEASQKPEFHALAMARQIHGGKIQRHPGIPAGWQVTDGADGHVTGSPGLLLTITVADCIPIYLAHPDSGTVALLHAGWRGVAAGILEHGIQELTSRANCSSSELVMHCGVGICGNCYEVGPEVISVVLGRQAWAPERLDLRGVLVERAGREGVREITVSKWCSSHDLDLFYSHRRSRGSDGRMVAYLGVPAIPG